MLIDIAGQIRTDPALQMGLDALFLLTASLVGGLGRMFFLTFLTWRLARLAALAGLGGGAMLYLM